MAEITVFYEGPIVTIAEARALGLKRYFAGKPCKHGHIAQRLVSCRRCCRCALLQTLEFHKTEAGRAAMARRDASEKRKAAKRAHYHAIKDEPWMRQYLEQRTISGKAKEAVLRYIHTEKGKAKRKEYGQSESGKEAIVRYERSEKRRASNARALARYRASEKGKQSAAVHNSRRRARKKSADGTFTSEDLKKLLSQQQKCHICGKKFTNKNLPTIDHIRALTDGGTNHSWNIALACKSCNCSKNNNRTHLI